MNDVNNTDRNDNDTDTNGATDMTPYFLMILAKADNELVACLPKNEAMASFSTLGTDFRLVPAPSAVKGDDVRECTVKEMWNSTVAKAESLRAAGWEFRFKVLPKGWDTPPKDEPQSYTEVTKPGTVDTARAKEQRALGEALGKAGFEWAMNDGLQEGLWFDGGTAMMASGEQRRFAYQKTHAEMPDAVPALKGFIEMLKSERRTARVVDITDMEAVPAERGIKLRRKNSGQAGVPVERWALEQVLDRYKEAFPNAKSLFRVMTPESAAKVFNDQLLRLPRSWDASSLKRPPSKLNLGMRFIQGEWRIYRAASDSYLEMPADMVAQAYIDEIEALGLPNAKASVSYDPVTTDVVIEVSWHDPRKRQPRVGDPIEFGFKGSTSDRGGRAHRSSGYTKQIQCVNCTILVRVSGASRQNHRGGRNATSAGSIRNGMAKVRAAIRNVVKQHEEGVNVLLNHWGILEATPLAAFGDTPLKAFEALVADPSLKGKGVTAMDLMNAYRNRPSGQPGDNGMAIANALTQAAHTSGLTPFRQKTLEEVIGIEVLPALVGAANRHKAETAKKANLV